MKDEITVQKLKDKGGIFRVAGPYQISLDCICRTFDGHEVTGCIIPPIHDGCTCYIEKSGDD